MKALLYEIKTQMGKGDRGVLIFGEELSELGMDVTSDEYVEFRVVVRAKLITVIRPVLCILTL